MASLSNLLNPQAQQASSQSLSESNAHDINLQQLPPLSNGSNASNPYVPSQTTSDEAPQQLGMDQSDDISINSTVENKQRRSRKKKSTLDIDNKQYQTLLLNSRSRHLKKNDGEPYWRNEIQFEFLMRLFFNYDRVFTNPYYGTPEGFDWPDHFKIFKTPHGECVQNDGRFLTFFELYLVTLLKSSKISKILKARLMVDINYALNFAIVCLLVNIGRLNTTVNFDHEMKSQFRTYHSVPSLQVGNHLNIIQNYYLIEEKSQPQFDEEMDDSKKKRKLNQNQSNALIDSQNQGQGQGQRGSSGYTMATVKQLQDTPRIKSILKSVNDLNNVPKTFIDFVKLIHESKDSKPLNLISVIFLLCVHEFEIGRSFYPVSTQPKSPYPENIQLNSTGSLFNDIWMRPCFNASDKVGKFLWLLFTFMETNLEVGKILQNPFNKREYIDLVASRLPPDIQLYDYVIMEAPEMTEVINIISLLLPNINFVMEGSAVDILINDYDTEQEVEYAAYMKTLRCQFVGEGSTTQEKVTQSDEAQLFNNNGNANNGYDNGNNNGQIITLVRSNGDLKSENDSQFGKVSSSSQIVDSVHLMNDSNENSNQFITNSMPTDSQINIIEELEKLAPIKFDNLLKRKSIFESVEVGALEPTIISRYDDTNNDIEAEGQKRKKRTKKQINTAMATELPLNICIDDIKALLNAQIKTANSNSKSAILKRNKNKLIAEFIYDIIKFKIGQLGDKRRLLGNWKYLIKEGHDLSFFLDNDLDLNEMGNWGEFKITILKLLTRLSCLLNGKIAMDERLGGVIQSQLKGGLTDFIDDAFSKL